MAESPEQKPLDQKISSKDMLIEGCINDDARELLSQMLSRRLAEVDANGQQAQFIFKLQNELNQLPSCAQMLGETEEKKEAPKNEEKQQ